MSSEQTRYRTLKDVPAEEYMAPGTPLCAGCGAQLSLRLALKALGPHTIVVNVPGCMALMAIYPFASLKLPFVFTSFVAAPATAQGIVDAIDVLRSKGVHLPDDTKVLVVTGDGAAYDIGLQSTSGTLHRQLDYYYFVYDNEAYGNTGFQYSAASPFLSRTTTSEATSRVPGNLFWKKDLFEIWNAHHVPYIATVAASKPVDLLRKFEKASKFKGPKLFLALGVCPTGWGSDPQQTVKIDRLAVETGMWPLKESVYGEVRHTYIPKTLKPLEEYLKTQKRFSHLFYPVRRDDLINEYQARINAYWEKVWKTELK
jgi:pyruvate ferredoxin oxidoreductase beta subunit